MIMLRVFFLILGKKGIESLEALFAYFNLTYLTFLATYLEGMQGSIAVNLGVDLVVVVLKSTKHKNIRMISKYSHGDDETKIINPARVALAANKDEKNKKNRNFEGNLW